MCRASKKETKTEEAKQEGQLIGGEIALTPYVDP